uniref:Uncharacterized protein n=1 Tax=Rousettus aegyptiacus TaxID=9407 RepID=A0A7J8BF25_ROUAE|nr:hypothetical protein HJG63_009768 [Rousettus aegyptiacus]
MRPGTHGGVAARPEPLDRVSAGLRGWARGRDGGLAWPPVPSLERRRGRRGPEAQTSVSAACREQQLSRGPQDAREACQEQQLSRGPPDTCGACREQQLSRGPPDTCGACREQQLSRGPQDARGACREQQLSRGPPDTCGACQEQQLSRGLPDARARGAPGPRLEPQRSFFALADEDTWVWNAAAYPE